MANELKLNSAMENNMLLCCWENWWTHYMENLS